MYVQLQVKGLLVNISEILKCSRIFHITFTIPLQQYKAADTLLQAWGFYVLLSRSMPVFQFTTVRLFCGRSVMQNVTGWILACGTAYSSLLFYCVLACIRLSSSLSVVNIQGLQTLLYLLIVTCLLYVCCMPVTRKYFIHNYNMCNCNYNNTY